MLKYLSNHQIFKGMNETSLNLEQEASNENTSPERLAELAKMNDSFACLVAQNINTYPETLTQLAESENIEIRKTIVRNPNTPTETLIELGVEFSEELAENPIIDLWLLEDNCFLFSQKNELKEYDECNLAEIASNLKTPINLLNILAQSSITSVREEVASNPKTTISILEKLATDSDNYIRGEVAKNPQTPMILLEKLADDSNNYVRVAVTEPQNHIFVRLFRKNQ